MTAGTLYYAPEGTKLPKDARHGLGKKYVNIGYVASAETKHDENSPYTILTFETDTFGCCISNGIFVFDHIGGSESAGRLVVPNGAIRGTQPRKIEICAKRDKKGNCFYDFNDRYREKRKCPTCGKETLE